MTPRPLANRLIAEAIGTFCLVFAGTGAIMVNDVTGGAVSHVGVALTFGLVVMAMIYAIGDVSGAHINPAVSLGFWFAGRLPRTDALAYCGAQLGGAIAASGALRLLFPESATLGETVPAGAPMQSFTLEVILTFMLMFVILAVATGAKEKGVMAGVAVGGVVAFEAMFAGPVSGASMNPARSMAPAFVAIRLDHVWVYIAAPILGAAIAVVAMRLVHWSPSEDENSTHRAVDAERVGR